MFGGPQHFAALGRHHCAGLLLQAVAEGVVGRDKKPVLAATLRDGAGRHVGQRIGVVDIVHGAGHAQIVGQAVQTGAIEDDHLLFLFGYLEHRERGGGDGYVHDGVYLASVEPFACLAGGDVGLVLVICHHQFDFLAQYLAAKVVDGHLDSCGAARPGDVGKGAIQVGQDAQAHQVVRNFHILGGSGGRGSQQCETRAQRAAGATQGSVAVHGCLLRWCVYWESKGGNGCHRRAQGARQT